MIDVENHLVLLLSLWRSTWKEWVLLKRAAVVL